MELRDFVSLFLCVGGALLFIVLGAVLSLVLSGRPITTSNVLSSAVRGLRWIFLSLILELIIESLFNVRVRRRF